MPTFEVKSPSGRVYRVNAPEGATQEQAIEYAATVLEPRMAAIKPHQEVRPESQGFAMDALAGAGKAFTDIGLGVRQMVGLADGAEAAEKRRLDAPLMATAGGMTGAIAGGVAATIPALAIPGAASVTGAGLIGAGLGAVQPAESGMERLTNTALGGAFGAGGQKAGMALAQKAKQVGADRIVSAAAAQREAQPALDLIKKVRDAGYVIPPSTTNPSRLNAGLESLAGKVNTSQTARIKNQEVTNRLARQSLGLPKDSPLSVETLRSIRTAEGRVYDKLAKSGEVAADQKFLDDMVAVTGDADTVAGAFGIDVADAGAIQKLVGDVLKDKADASAYVALSRNLRDSAKGNFRKGNNELARAERQIANSVEDLLERHAGKVGEKGLVKRFKQARERIAKTYSVESALKGQNVSARKLASQMEKGKPLSGGLRLIAEFGQSFDDAAKVPSGSPVRLTDAASGAVGVAGLATGNPLAASALALPVARSAARGAILSGPVQNNLLMQSYAPRLMDARAAQLLGQYGPRGAAPVGLLGVNPEQEEPL